MTIVSFHSAALDAVAILRTFALMGARNCSQGRDMNALNDIETTETERCSTFSCSPDEALRLKFTPMAFTRRMKSFARFFVFLFLADKHSLINLPSHARLRFLVAS